MVDSVKARWVGREKVLKTLNNLSPLIEKELAIKQLQVAGDLAARIRERAPVGGMKWRRGRSPGQYRRSIIAARVSEGGGALHGIVRTKDPNAAGIYAEFVWRWLEFGSVNNVARPHVFPTYRQRKKYIVRTLKRAVNTAIKKATAGKAPAPASDNG